MVAVGIGIGFVILLIEIGYSKYETMKEKQNNIAKKAVARWKRYVQVCITLTGQLNNLFFQSVPNHLILEGVVLPWKKKPEIWLNALNFSGGRH